MNGMERRKLCCSISFHMVAITCVVWSLYVLIDRSYSHSCLCTWIKNMWQRIRIRILSTVYYQLLTFKNYSTYINLSSFQNQRGNSEWWATVAILDKISCGCNRFYRFDIHTSNIFCFWTILICRRPCFHVHSVQSLHTDL